jgi:hypothetical protein
MQNSKAQYREIIVENFVVTRLSRRHRAVSTRPIPGQGVSTKLYVQVPAGITKYPAGARFLIRAKLTHPKNGRPYLKSYHSWDFTVIRPGADPDGQARANKLADVDRIRRTIKNKTTREALIDARLGQGRFRSEVGKRWGNRCAVTGCAIGGADDCHSPANGVIRPNGTSLSVRFTEQKAVYTHFLVGRNNLQGSPDEDASFAFRE